MINNSGYKFQIERREQAVTLSGASLPYAGLGFFLPRVHRWYLHISQ